MHRFLARSHAPLLARASFLACCFLFFSVLLFALYYPVSLSPPPPSHRARFRSPHARHANRRSDSGSDEALCSASAPHPSPSPRLQSAVSLFPSPPSPVPVLPTLYSQPRARSLVRAAPPPCIPRLSLSLALSVPLPCITLLLTSIVVSDAATMTATARTNDTLENKKNQKFQHTSSSSVHDQARKSN